MCIAKISLGLRNFCYAIAKCTVLSAGSCGYCSIGHCSLHPILQLAIFLFSSLLSSWSLMYGVEFDSNSSCLDRLNNVGMISSQKLKNLPQNAISRIVGTLMCKSG